MAPRAPLALAALLVLLLPGYEAGGDAGGACNLTQFSTQLDSMLATYDLEWPPATPAVVEVGLQARHATINEATATVRLLADFHMSWEDLRLGWNASEGDGVCGSVLVAAERLWRPDVGVLSAASTRATGDGPMRARVSAAGRVNWLVRLDLEAPITLDLTAWPHDQHEIVFKFGSRSHFEDEIELKLSDIETATVFESGSWEIMSIAGSEVEWIRADTHTRVAQYLVTLRRRAAAHSVASSAVLCAAGLLLVSAALLPPAARAPLCAAASFTAALWLSVAVSRLGSTGSAPRVLGALGALCACGGAGAAAAAAAMRVARCTRSAPSALRRLRTHPAVLRLFSSLEVPGGGEESGVWVASARLLDALCVILLLLVVLIIELLVIFS